MQHTRVVVLAEDDTDARECVAAILREEGFDVRSASHGGEALEILDALGDEHCLLLLDLMMPFTSGFDVVEILARDGRLAHIPIIVCSAWKGETPLPAGIRVLAKPINLESLLRCVEECCEADTRRESPLRRLRVAGADPSAR